MLKKLRNMASGGKTAAVGTGAMAIAGWARYKGVELPADLILAFIGAGFLTIRASQRKLHKALVPEPPTEKPT